MPQAVGELLRNRCSADPVHGISQRFTQPEVKDISAILAERALDLDSPVLDQLFGETIIDIEDYLNERDPLKRKEFKDRILTALDEAREREGERPIESE